MAFDKTLEQECPEPCPGRRTHTRRARARRQRSNRAHTHAAKAKIAHGEMSRQLTSRSQLSLSPRHDASPSALENMLIPVERRILPPFPFLPQKAVGPNKDEATCSLFPHPYLPACLHIYTDDRLTAIPAVASPVRQEPAVHSHTWNRGLSNNRSVAKGGQEMRCARSSNPQRAIGSA